MQSSNKQVVRVGSRRSQLALIQTNLAIRLLKEKYPNFDFEVVEIVTTGDKILNVALSKIGDKSLFTKELEKALFDCTVDFVVHSLKDVPTTMPSGLVLGCVFDRKSPEDVVLMSPKHRGKKLSDLPAGSVVGTSAVRRVATLSRLYPTLKFVSVRGNLNTRIRHLDKQLPASADNSSPDGAVYYDAIILAKAGIDRLGWSDRIDETLIHCMHAVSQGALACECRQYDDDILSILSSLHDESAALGAIAERSLMRELDGGCSTPIGVRSQLTSQTEKHSYFLKLEASVLSIDGRHCVEGSVCTAFPSQLPETTKPPCSNVDQGAQRELQCTAVKNEDNQSASRDDLNIDSNSNCDGHTFLECIEMDPNPTEEELRMAGDSSSVFMGLYISPSCPIDRLRMARSQQLGATVASRLLRNGGSELLDQMRTSAITQPSKQTMKN